jgi:hypothetical protein
MPRSLSSASSLDNLRKEAKRWLKDVRAGDAVARARLERAYPSASERPALRDVQHALAREYGCDDWAALKDAVAKLAADTRRPAPTVEENERLARDLVGAFNDRDDAALRRLNDHYGRTFTFDDLWAEVWRRVYAFRQRAFRSSAKQQIELAEAQLLIAQDAGFGSWSALTAGRASGAQRVPPYVVDPEENRIGPRRRLTDAEWDELIAVMKERRITGLSAGGLMTDAVLGRIAALDHVTALGLGGSRELTDDGLHYLARMPQLRDLNLSEYPGGKLTDRGLEVLRQLPNLRRFEMTWQRGITDGGVANLRFCDRLESVDLMGSPTGDGAIEALHGKASLRRFASGRLVTDTGLALLKTFPRLRTWRPDPGAGEHDKDAAGARLLIDGPFTNEGLALLAGLEGLADLDLFWHVTGITTEGFAHLVDLPNLAALGADGTLTDDVSMRYMGAMPRLRRLRAQGTIATDDGFESLSRSTTLEGFWGGKDELKLGDRGFLALSRMPSLRSLGVSCKHVSDAALAALPRFHALREITPVDMTDDGFRHVGRCERLERLTCMYCRTTTDAATEHIAALRLRYYYAGLTQITDRSLEILGGMDTLEEIEFYECQRITDAGLPFLARLPRLRKLEVHNSPDVTFAGTRIFPASVLVKYGT